MLCVDSQGQSLRDQMFYAYFCLFNLNIRFFTLLEFFHQVHKKAMLCYNLSIGTLDSRGVGKVAKPRIHATAAAVHFTDMLPLCISRIAIKQVQYFCGAAHYSEKLGALECRLTA